MDKLEQLYTKSDVKLEPRLYEYLRMRMFNKQNKIEAQPPLEIQYQISNDDLKMIRQFAKGEYDQKSYRLPKYEKQTSPFLKIDDKRVLKAEKQQMNVPVNMNMFAEDDGWQKITKPTKGRTYNDVIQNKQYDERKGFNYNFSRADPRHDPRIYPGRPQQTKKDSSYKVCNDKPPKMNRNLGPKPKFYNAAQHLDGDIFKNPGTYNMGSLPPSNINNSLPGQVDGLLDNTNKYGYLAEEHEIHTELPSSFKNTEYNYFAEPTIGGMSEMDTINKVVIPQLASNSKQLNVNRFHEIPMERTMKNVDIEACMVNGMPNHTAKSYGFRNPEEHYFQYIDDNLQHPDNVVFPIPRGGFSSRSDNTTVARPERRYYR